MKNTYTYQVIETNGGGLYLYVFRDGALVYGHSGYEHVSGQLLDDISAIRDEDFTGTDNWDGNELTIADYNDDIDRLGNGCELVCDEDGVYADRFGHAASVELGG